MTIEQAAERFRIAPDKLKHYEELGLFDCHRQADGSVDYCDELLEYVGTINVLMEAGAAAKPLKVFMNRLMQSSLSKSEKLTFLREQRQLLLDCIHSKQKSLDQLDFLIYETTKH